MKTFIPSYNRPRCVFALEVFPAATVVVPASQEAEYRRCNPGADILAIPDDQDGNLARKRTAIAALGATEPDAAYLVVDDDVSGLWDKVVGRAVTSAEAAALVDALGARAKAEGAVMFGLNPARQLPWKPEAEWTLNGGYAHFYGFRGDAGLAFGETVSGFESTDLFFQCRERGLTTLRWDRYAVEAVRGNVGGSNRASTQCREAGLALARKWGPRVVDLTPDGLVCGLNLNAVKRLA